MASAAIRLHAECAYTSTHTLITQSGEKHLYPRPLAPAVNDKKIIVFRRNGQKAETVKLRHRFDGEPPIGTALCNRGCDRIVRFRLIGVPGRPRTTEQFIG